jgi:hypothetical protein
MKTQMSHQEAFFRRHGFYDHMAKAPTAEEAIQHALNTINNAFGKKN